VTVLALLAFAGVAQAHPGASGHEFADGVAHPFQGLDHLLAAVAVGLWGAQRGGRALWALPAAFLVAMVAGGAAAAAGIAFPAVEPVLLASVLVLGLAVASAARPPLAVAIGVTALFALAHGNAHGSETAGAAAFAGIVLATAALHAVGAGLALGAAAVRYLAGGGVPAGGSSSPSSPIASTGQPSSAS
jgi:urease accessory protein